MVSPEAGFLGGMAAAIVSVVALVWGIFRARGSLVTRLDAMDERIDELDQNKATQEALQHLTADVDRLVKIHTKLGEKVDNLIVMIARGDFRPKQPDA